MPTIVPITRAGTIASTTGVMVLTSTDANGSGPYSPRSNGMFTDVDNLAVYEVLFSDPYVSEDFNISFTTSGFPQGVQPKAIVSFAPFYSTTGSGDASGPLPEPRFIDPCVTAPCFSLLPTSARTGDLVNVAISSRLATDSSAQLFNGAQIKLVAPGQPDITATSVRISGRVAIAAFNLAGAAAGKRDLVITPTVGAPIAAPNGFTVSATVPCSYTVGSMAPLFTAAGGSGSLVVSPVPVDCPWSASTADSWITLAPKQGSVQPISVAPNPDSIPRFGTVAIAGKTVTVQQRGGTCSYVSNIDPSNLAIPPSGGTITISISTSQSCQWWVQTAVTWLGQIFRSGYGNGSVTLTIAPNTTGQPLKEGIYLNDRTFIVSQAPQVCFTDLSAQVRVTRGAMLSNFAGTRYTQQLTFTNVSGATISSNISTVLGMTADRLAAPAASVLTCFPTAYYLAPIVPVTTAPLAAGQSVTVNLQFTPGKANGGTPPIYNLTVGTF
ncbi:MAG: BACON domain-containing carbohydrate-binding protein [Acidobacteriota bacterium]